MRSSKLLFDRLLSPSAISLGRFVLDVESPDQDFYVHNEPLDESDVVTEVYDNFVGALNSVEKKTFQTELTRLLSASFEDDSSSATRLSSIRKTTYQLQNSSEFFEKLCSSVPARKWLEKARRRGRKVYIVTGLETVTNASASVRAEQLKDAGGTVDLGHAVITATAGPGVSDILGPLEIGISTRGQSSGHTRFSAPGERVIAAQFRKVEFRWFSSSRIDKSTLEKRNRWTLYFRTRGHQEVEVEEDVIEVVLSDEVPLDGDEYEKISLNEVDYLFPS